MQEARFGLPEQGRDYEPPEGLRQADSLAMGKRCVLSLYGSSTGTG